MQTNFMSEEWSFFMARLVAFAQRLGFLLGLESFLCLRRVICNVLFIHLTLIDKVLASIAWSHLLSSPLVQSTTKLGAKLSASDA